jgi:hypothetical protein
MVLSHNIVFHRHRLQKPLAGSRGFLGRGLEEDNQHIMRVGRTGDALPQLQFMVVEGLQYAALAK